VFLFAAKETFPGAFLETSQAPIRHDFPAANGGSNCSAYCWMGKANIARS
jgi:hypothetical protein